MKEVAPLICVRRHTQKIKETNLSFQILFFGWPSERSVPTQKNSDLSVRLARG